MAKRNTEFFIARRISGARTGDARNVMVRMATVAVAVGMAAIVVSTAVISGFGRELTGKLSGFGAHVQLVSLSGGGSLESAPIMADTALERRIAAIDGFRSLHAYAVKGGVFKHNDAIQGVMLKGVDGRFDWSFFERNLVEGAVPRVGDTVRHKDILIARSLAVRMNAAVDDRVEILFIGGDAPPRRDRFRVSGIYDTGMDEMEMMVVMTDLRNISRLNGWADGQVTGYEIRINDTDRLDEFDARVEEVLSSRQFYDRGIGLLDIRSQYHSLFDWLKTHRVNGVVITTIMLVVALLNMIAALLIIVLERTSMIGTLKALGMDNGRLRRLFVIRSSFIVLWGMLWGNAAGIGLCLLQKYTGLARLDGAGYFLTRVPVYLDWWNIALLNAGTFVLITALLTLPTAAVSSISPDKTIRYR